MAFTVNKKAFCVLEFAKTESIVTVQRRFRIMYHTEPPTDKTIREWYMNSSRVAACVLQNEQAVRAYGPGRAVRFARKYAKAPSTKKTWRDSLLIYMLLSAVSVLVVAQSSSEIPEGLMNNPGHDADRHASGNPLLCVWTPIRADYVNQNNFKCIQASAHDNWCGADTKTPRQVMRYRYQHNISDVVQTSAQHKWCGSDISTW